MRQELRITAASLAIYALYLPVALSLHSHYIPAQKPLGIMVEPLADFKQAPGFSYRAISYMLASHVDASEDNMRAPVVVYEDKTALGPARSYIRDVQAIGKGHFAFVRYGQDPRAFVVFSTSDNTDPRTNGRRYWLVLPE